jgi:hypothetical protein
MNSAHLLVRIAPFVLALLLGALASSGHPVSSQPQEEGQLQWWAVAEPHANGMPLAATGPGHVDGWGIRRCPSLASGYPCIWPVPDKILFTEDYAGGLGIIVSGAEVHDKWTWSHYYPPEGGDPDWACWMQIRNPGEAGNPTQRDQRLGVGALRPGRWLYSRMTTSAALPTSEANLRGSPPVA